MAHDPTMKHLTFSNDSGDRNIAIYIAGELHSCRDDHPNWDEILKAAEAKDDRVLDLLKPADTIARKFAELTDRISVHDGTILWDGEAMHNSLTQKILSLMDERVEDWRVFVAFMENLYTNPNEHSRTMAFDYLMKNHFTITPNGNFLAYKGVFKNTKGQWVSSFAGNAIVNDEQLTDVKIPNAPGSIVRMPRADVKHDPASACHIGLHVATFEFAQGFGQTVLEVEVNPRDIVSVPSGGWNNDAKKLRVCRYKVLDVVTEPSSVSYQKATIAPGTPSVVVEPVCAPVQAPEGAPRPKVAPTIPYPAAEPQKPAKDVTIVAPATTYSSGDNRTPTAKVSKVKRPTQDEFDTMVKRAKRRKQNITKYATKQGPWEFTGTDPFNRKHWEK